MTRWIFKSLLMEPLTLFTALTSVAGAFLLVLLFEGLFAGEAQQIVAYVRNADADVWVMQRGVSNMHMATSYLPDWKIAQVREIDEVADVEAILYMNTLVESGDNRWFSYVVGLNMPATISGPWSMSEGRAKLRPGEAVVPDVFARMAGLGIGDSVRLTDRSLKVVGLSHDTFSMANSVIFIHKIDLEDIMKSLDISSFMLVKAKPGVDPAVLAEKIEARVDNVHALPADKFLENDKRMAMQMGTETIALMSVIGSVLATLLVAFTVYSQISRQRRELAVAKALGVSNRAMYGAVMVQAIAISVLGVVLAILLSLFLMPLLTNAIPAITMRMTAGAIVKVTVVGVTVAIAAALVPARQVARLDPLSAFHI